MDKVTIGRATLYNADCRDVPIPDECQTVVCDPPFDAYRLNECGPVKPGRFASALVFCDPRNLGAATDVFGGPSWCFTWDCLNTWSAGPSRPVQQAKHCLWYGELGDYRRDGALWGKPPAGKDHPSTKSEALAGRRLTDVYRESLRWLHCETATGGTARWAESDNPMRHAKPVGWLECLLGNCGQGSIIYDPFMGSGAAGIAAANLGLDYVGVEVDPQTFDFACRRIADAGVQQQLFA